MALFNRTRFLLDLHEASTEDQAGHGYAIVPRQQGDIEFRVFIDLEQSGGTGTPTSAVHVETSHDAESWIPVITPVSLNANGETHEFKEIAAMGPLVRARTVLGGGTNPSHKATVKLASTADFDLKVKSRAGSSSDDAEDPEIEGPGIIA